ncbi:MAG: U32 family peptidase [Clostridia bacterium]
MDKKSEQIRILAPVGGQEQLLAAVRCGADAIYLGAKGFNARRNAENFAEDSLPEAIAYCHEHNVGVYVTVNTLVMDDELPQLVAEVDAIADAGADAVIVQDLMVAKLIRERFPSLPLLGSTQTTVHNAEGARVLQELGFSQVVLARELSIDEIRAIAEASSLRLEVFVHGALCMCMSGACYLSSVIGTRSGNRGLCAQPCRTNFQLDGDGREYALSLKDMSVVTHIDALRTAGVSVLKIEGRMKRPEYVAAAVTACRQVLAGEKPDMEALQAIFSRSGFTDGYLTGKRTIDMFGHRTREDVTATAKVLNSFSNLYARENGSVPVDLSLVIRAAQPSVLTATDGVYSAEVTGSVAEEARSVVLTAEVAKKNLSQMGGTPYVLHAFTAVIDEGMSLSVSAQKQLRRDVLSELTKMRKFRPKHEGTGAIPTPLPKHRPTQEPAIRVRFETVAQMFDTPEAERVLLPLAAIEELPQMLTTLRGRLICELPALCFPEEMDALRSRILALKAAGLTDVLVNNLGLLRLASELELTIHGDYGLNILNSVSLNEYARLDCVDATVSFELAMTKIRALTGTLPRGILAYGYLPLMKMRVCPAQDQHGCGGCNGRRNLMDSKGEPFMLLCHERRYTELLNGVPLYIGDKPTGEVDFVTLRFTKETQEQAERVYQQFLRKEVPEFSRTSGLYFRQLQ